MAIAPAQAAAAWFGARLACRRGQSESHRGRRLARDRGCPAVLQRHRPVIRAERINRFCGRLNDGLIAVTIVLATLVFLAGAYRAAETLVIPQSFETIGITGVSPATRGASFALFENGTPAHELGARA